MDLFVAAVGILSVLATLLAARWLSRRANVHDGRSTDESNSATQQRIAEFAARAAAVADELLGERADVGGAEIAGEPPNEEKARRLSIEFGNKLSAIADEMALSGHEAEVFLREERFREAAFEKFVRSRQTPQQRDEAKLRAQRLLEAFDEYDRAQKRERRAAILKALPSAILLLVLTPVAMSIFWTGVGFMLSMVFQRYLIDVQQEARSYSSSCTGSGAGSYCLLYA